MNENIQKLYSKVLNESAERWNPPDAEKFARLIILECVKIADADRDPSIGCGYITKSIGDHIIEHFGVER